MSDYEQTRRLLSTTDAAVWAAEFMANFGDRLNEVDEGLMVGWFANAIEVGRGTDEGGILHSLHRLLDPLDTETRRQALDAYEASQDVDLPAPDLAVWSCKVGRTPRPALPHGSDAPMRAAVAECYRQLTGDDPDFIFSGWGGRLTEAELAVVEDRAPR